MQSHRLTVLVIDDIDDFKAILAVSSARCNITFGMLKDDIELLRKAMAYLENTRTTDR